jgi:hypothetical protein
MTDAFTDWNPWAPYVDYDAYHAANFKIAQILGWETGGEATKVAKQYGQSTVYTAMLSGSHYVVTWDDKIGAVIMNADAEGHIISYAWTADEMAAQAAK